MEIGTIIDYSILGVVGALALFAWLVLRQRRKQGKGCGSCTGCPHPCASQKEDKDG